MNINCQNGLIFKKKIILRISNFKNDSFQNTSIFVQSISSHKNYYNKHGFKKTIVK